MINQRYITINSWNTERTIPVLVLFFLFEKTLIAKPTKTCVYFSYIMHLAYHRERAAEKKEKIRPTVREKRVGRWNQLDCMNGTVNG